MRYLKITLLLLLTFIFISSCGYKVIDGFETKDFNLKEIQLYGDKRINFKIKNDLIFNNSKSNNNNIIMELHTNKTKNVKEKNIKNEITKYEISLNSKIQLNFIELGLKETFQIFTAGSYTVSDKYSTTLKNEKRLIDDLTNDISNKIQKRINLIINDL